MKYTSLRLEEKAVQYIIRIILSLIIIVLTILLSPNMGQTADQHNISARQAIVMDEETGRVLFEKNAYEKRPIASITKVMTAIIAIEYGDLSEEVTVSRRALQTEGSSIYLQENEKISLEDLLYGLMLRSGNDAALAIAEHIGGSVEGFTYLMNEKAAYIGMVDTRFKNPHGLDEEGHYSTAYDIALLMQYAMQNETFRKISGTKSYQAQNRTYKWFNKNKLLRHLYPYCTGGKTGYTKRAGRTLVTTAEKDGHSLIVVTFHAPNDWQDHIQLYDYYFSQLERILLDEKGVFTRLSERSEPVIGHLKDDVILSLKPEEKALLHKHIFLKAKPENERVAEVHYLLGDQVLYKKVVYTYPNQFVMYWQMTLDVIRDVLGMKRND